MKNAVCIAAAAVGFGLLYASWAAAQENEQKAVIGFGIGAHTYSETDQVRQTAFLVPENGAGFGELFFEWYAFGSIGVGVREVVTTQAETVVTPLGTVDTEVSSGSFLLTLNAVPWISSDRYVRIGVLGGLGRTRYTVTQSVGNISTEFVTSGPSNLIQAYLDWGGDVFGARFTIGHLGTNLDPLNDCCSQFEADASGNHAAIDLRWALE